MGNSPGRERMNTNDRGFKVINWEKYLNEPIQDRGGNRGGTRRGATGPPAYTNQINVPQRGTWGLFALNSLI